MSTAVHRTLQQLFCVLPNIFFVAPAVPDGMVLRPTMEGGMNDNLWVLFEQTGQRFPVRFYSTSDRYTVELPCGVYEGEKMADLRRELKADFKRIRITSK